MNRRRNQFAILPAILVGIGLLLIGGTAAWYLLNLQARPAAGSQAGQEASIPYPEVKRVSLGDAKAAYETGTAIFVDVRAKQFYDEQHIPGALSLPEDELPNRLDELKRSDWIITYCT